LPFVAIDTSVLVNIEDTQDGFEWQGVRVVNPFA
jgi:predicted nucleic acid-binding protein